MYCLGQDVDALQVPPTNEGRLAFLSSTVYAVSTGGVAVADAVCQSDADAASLPGTFLAMVATTGSSAADRFDSGAPWVRPDGVLLADTDDALFTAALWHAPINVHADKSYFLANSYVAGGANTPTEAGTDMNNCGDWKSPSGQGLIGRVLYSSVLEAFGDGPFTSSACDSANLRLYCLEN